MNGCRSGPAPTALAGAFIHELLHADRVDFEFLVRYTNAHHLVIRDPGGAGDGLIARDADGRALCAARGEDGTRIVDAGATGIAAQVVGEYRLDDGRTAVPAFQLLAERYLDASFAPEAVAERCGVPAATIRRLAAELADTAFAQAITLEQPWTDAGGREHATMTGRPVAMHAMRGISAHVNGFHTCRALHVLQMLLGAIDTPGSFRYQPPYPKPIPPPNRPGRTRRDNGTLDGGPLGFVHAPADLLVDAEGRPRRIDKAYSWEHPLAAHGLMHSVIRNAWAGDPYRIDTLLMFMANMGWNSAMNTTGTRRMLCDRDPASGSTAFRTSSMRMPTPRNGRLRRPRAARHDLSRASRLHQHARPADLRRRCGGRRVRQPVLAPDRDVRPFQDVLLDLGARLGLPGMVDDAGRPKYPRGFAQYMVEHERTPGVGLLAGWRGSDGSSEGAAR